MTTKPVDGSSDGESSSDIIYTPAESDSTAAPSHLAVSTERTYSPSPLRLSSLPKRIQDDLGSDQQEARRHRREQDQPYQSDNDDLSDASDMSSTTRPSLHRPTGGLSHTPLLRDGKLEDERGRQDSQSINGSARPAFVSRRSTFRSKSPSFAQPENYTRRKYTYAAFFLLLSLITFVVQTETARYIQHTLGWKKPYCMLWLTHGSWSFLWPMQLVIIRIQKRKLSWPAFWRRHKYLVRTTAQMVVSQDLSLSTSTLARSPWPAMFKTIAFITTFLTVAGGSWYVAVDMTSPSDLTAIYSCSAFWAYVFSIWLLKDKLRFDKLFAVGLAIAGVLIVAYGDQDPTSGGHSGGSTKPTDPADEGPSNQLLGNSVIGVGSVLYGLYEVLYKKYACPPEGTSPGRGMIFANTVGSMIGLFTLCVLWIALPILHVTGIEPFVVPRGQAAGLLAISTLSNAIFSGSFLVLMSLTSPVLSSVAALLTIFLVAIVDWLLTSKPLSGAAIGGGTVILVAFALLSWATYREMMEEQKRREAEDEMVFSDEDEEDDTK